MYTSDKEAIILEHIYYNDSLKQRELADKAGISLGMANAVLKGLVEKGLLEIKRSNNRNIKYVVSSNGKSELERQSYKNFKHAMACINVCRCALEELVEKAKADGFDKLVLVGKSDLAFLLEYVCGKVGVELMRVDNDKEVPRNMFSVYGELYEACNEVDENRLLRTLIMWRKNDE